jgi:hypothetical protein
VTPGRRWCLGALVLLVGSCSLRRTGRSLGQDVAQGGLEYLRSDSGRQHIRAFADSSLYSAAAAFRAQVQPTVDSTLQETLRRGTAALGQAEDDLAAQLDGQVSEALTALVRRNLRAAGDEGRTQLDLTLRRLSDGMERDLTPALQRSVTAATQSFMAQLSASVRQELRQAAESAFAGAVRAGVQAGGREAQRSPAWRTVLWIVGIGVAAIVFLGIAWLVRERRRSVAALDVVAEVINQSGTQDMKEQIKRRARDRDVEGWLRHHLQSRGYIG